MWVALRYRTKKLSLPSRPARLQRGCLIAAQRVRRGKLRGQKRRRPGAVPKALVLAVIRNRPPPPPTRPARRPLQRSCLIATQGLRSGELHGHKRRRLGAVPKALVWAAIRDRLLPPPRMIAKQEFRTGRRLGRGTNGSGAAITSGSVAQSSPRPMPQPPPPRGPPAPLQKPRRTFSIATRASPIG